ncbi:YjjG family noncanonical pyrimidine nucleotidase [Hymenobacter defluvii]|uniref:YjjG family noncanonical pyrimidine nucleotidase n=1 Tax=Hymenobacter defluvii TaxID=2054411 RepID=A0ABS3TDM1_9BACT|nr:YjjG family noncanonical pyrimidine nucleotidase [Hymenobacter defluvii]MBO3271448.1 YjjG family noncanonical pyrimidine nucleotidase [Hymenobacter defluvii]
MKTYRHLFFDLDHTLWDFETNSEEVLRFQYDDHRLARYGFTVEQFMAYYSEVNHALWRLYQGNKITQQQLRTTRFARTLTKLGVPEDELPADMSDQYTSLLPHKTAVFPYTFEVLDYLQAKGYTLHLLTNGFREIQHVKLSAARLTDYFREVITSECSGCLKPDGRMYQHALDRAGTTATDSLMIGDNLECDVLGAANAGLDQVYFNPAKRRHFAQTTYEIACLSELKEIL